MKSSPKVEPRDSSFNEFIEEKVDFLADEIDLARKWNRPSILLAVYGSEVVNSQAQDALEKKLKTGKQKVRRIKVDKENFDLAWFLAQFEDHENVVFFISGLRWGGGRSRSNAYEALNLRRELFVENKICLVLWLNEKEATDLPQHAPDFWAFRHRVVDFTEALVAPQTSIRRTPLFWHDWEVSESVSDLDQKIVLRESMLADLPITDASLFTRTDLLYTLAYFYWLKYNYERSALCLENALQLAVQPQAADMRSKFIISLGILFHDQHQWDKAETVFRKVIDFEPRNARAWNCLGVIFMDQGLPEQAEQAFRKAVKLSPRHANAWNNLGNIQSANGLYSEAINCYKKAARYDPSNPTPRINLAYAHLDSGHPDLAIRSFKKASRQLPDQPRLLVELGSIYREMSRHKDAISEFKQAIARDPQDHLAYAGLIGCYRMLGKPELARQQIDIALPFLSGLNAYQMAEFESFSGNKGEAIRLLEISLQKKQTTIHAIQGNSLFSGLHGESKFNNLLDQQL